MNYSEGVKDLDSEITAHDILQKDSFWEFLLLSLNVVKHRA